MSARSSSRWRLALPTPWPASQSSRKSTGLPLLLAACRRAPVLVLIHTTTRGSLTPCVPCQVLGLLACQPARYQSSP